MLLIVFLNQIEIGLFFFFFFSCTVRTLPNRSSLLEAAFLLAHSSSSGSGLGKQGRRCLRELGIPVAERKKEMKAGKAQPSGALPPVRLHLLMVPQVAQRAPPSGELVEPSSFLPQQQSVVMKCKPSTGHFQRLQWAANYD